MSIVVVRESIVDTTVVCTAVLPALVGDSVDDVTAVCIVVPLRVGSDSLDVNSFDNDAASLAVVENSLVACNHTSL